MASDIHERQGRAKFIDLVLFIKKQAAIVLDPLYGDIQDPVVARRALSKTTKEFKHSRARSSGSSFATTVKAVSDSTPEKERRPEINVSNYQCVYCTGDHSLFACQRLKVQPHKVKVDFAKSNGLCFGCLTK